MSLNYHKAKTLSLSEAGYDEKWLQERILEDPSMLGLGDLSVIQREKRQSAGGRLDFLMSDPETNTMYEIEVMLGETDESHIIRTIEYWDIERRHWPNRDHRAVIVAEKITNRFFNVISLLNRAIPVIAVQLSTQQVDDKITVNGIPVLDIYEPPEDEEGEAEPTDREWWGKHSNLESLGIVDRCVALLTVNGKGPRLTHNKYHIAMGGPRQNFCWFHPRKAQSHCHLHLKAKDGDLPAIAKQLEEAGISVAPHRKDMVRVIITPQEMKQHETCIRDVLKRAYTTVGGGPPS